MLVVTCRGGASSLHLTEWISDSRTSLRLTSSKSTIILQAKATLSSSGQVMVEIIIVRVVVVVAAAAAAAVGIDCNNIIVW